MRESTIAGCKCKLSDLLIVCGPEFSRVQTGRVADVPVVPVKNMMSDGAGELTSRVPLHKNLDSTIVRGKLLAASAHAVTWAWLSPRKHEMRGTGAFPYYMWADFVEPQCIWRTAHRKGLCNTLQTLARQDGQCVSFTRFGIEAFIHTEVLRKDCRGQQSRTNF